MEIHEIQFVKGVVRWEGLPDEGVPEVAFVGRSNVGKSSLLNMLAERKELARTSGTPGKTQQFNYYLVNQNLYFVDVPGFGYAKVSKKQRAKWGRFIGEYLTRRVPLRVVFHLVDSRHPPTQLDKDVMALMRGSPVPYIIVLTKADKLSNNQRQKSLASVQQVLTQGAMEVPVVFTSAKKGTGREELLTWIENLVAV